MKTTAALLRELKESINCIEEQARAPLYHATTLGNASNIIKDGALKIRFKDRTENGLSVTRSKDFAESEFSRRSFGPVVFHINQNTLIYNNKLRPFSWQDDENEFEERTNRDIDVRHITHISYPIDAKYDEHVKHMQFKLDYSANKRIKHIEIIRHWPRYHEYDEDEYNEYNDHEYDTLDI